MTDAMNPGIASFSLIFILLRNRLSIPLNFALASGLLYLIFRSEQNSFILVKIVHSVGKSIANAHRILCILFKPSVRGAKISTYSYKKTLSTIVNGSIPNFNSSWSHLFESITINSLTLSGTEFHRVITGRFKLGAGYDVLFQSNH